MNDDEKTPAKQAEAYARANYSTYDVHPAFSDEKDWPGDMHALFKAWMAGHSTGWCAGFDEACSLYRKGGK